MGTIIVTEFYGEREVSDQEVTLDYRCTTGGDVIEEGQLVFLSKEEYARWQYMRGLLTEDEFFDRVSKEVPDGS